MGQKVLLIYKSISISFGGIFINLYCQWQYFSTASTTQFYKPYVFWSCGYKKKKFIIVFFCFLIKLRLNMMSYLKRHLYFHIFELLVCTPCLFFYQLVNLFLSYFWNPLILWDINGKYVFLSLSFVFGLGLCCSAIYIISFMLLNLSLKNYNN